jgi:hypothetical protein
LKAARSSASAELLLDNRQNFIEDEGGKDRTEGVTLGKAFFLGEGAPLAVFIEVPDDIVSAVDEVEKWEEPTEASMAFKDPAAGRAGDSIEHVFEIKE